MPEAAPPPVPGETEVAVPEAEAPEAEAEFSLDDVDLRATLVRFYEINAPDKVGRIDDVLAQYVGEEYQLLEDLVERYQVAEEELTSCFVYKSTAAAGSGRPPLKPTKPLKPAKPMPLPRPPAAPAAAAAPRVAAHNGGEENEEDGDEDGEAFRAARASVSTVPPLRIGTLTKVRIKDGALQSLLFVLKSDALFYVKKKPLDGVFKFLHRVTGLDLGTSTMIERNTRNMDLTKLMASALRPEDRQVLSKCEPLQEVNLDCVFVVRSKRKSFYAVAPSPADCDGWCGDIEAARKAAQEPLGRLVTEEQCCPLYSFKAEASDCSQCGRSFGLMARRHHCRQCGVVVCEGCSRNKVRIPRLVERMLFKCCNKCTAELKKARRYGAASVI